MRKIIVDEHFIMYRIRLELGIQICINKHTANLAHDGAFVSFSQSI